VSAGTLIPAGWLSAPDLLYRLSDFVISVRGREGLPATSERMIALAAAAIAGSAMSLPRPSLAAFVRSDGEWFQVPSTAWLSTIEKIAADEAALLDVLNRPTLPEAFGPYAGRTTLFNSEHAVVFVDMLSRSLTGGGHFVPRDPDKPWRDYTSVSAWLSSSAATVFADARLAEGGMVAPRPVDRNRELYAYLKAQGEAFEFESVESCRRPSRMRR
jgi:hypothetical protein